MPEFVWTDEMKIAAAESRDKQVEKARIRWHNLCKELGEQEAKKQIANLLRQFADAVEAEGYPDIYHVEFPDGYPKDFYFGKEIGARIEISLSFPWGG